MNVKNAAAAANAGEHQHVLEVELASLQACIHAEIAAYQHPESNQQAYAIQAAIMSCISSPHACIVPPMLWQD